MGSSGWEVRDFGTYSESSVDYPDIAIPVAEAVARGEGDYGVLICGTGIGMAITANKVKGVMAARLTDVFSAKMAKRHNRCNVVTLGGRLLGSELAKELLKTFFSEKFEGGRHERRLKKIRDYEEGKREEERETLLKELLDFLKEKKSQGVYLIPLSQIFERFKNHEKETVWDVLILGRKRNHILIYDNGDSLTVYLRKKHEK
jgi:ribose 5-phosphate isomerase B